MKTESRYGKRIKEERQKRGWTQEHLAEVAGIAPRTIARTEKDEVQGFDSLMAIGAALGMELRELVQTFRIAEAKPLRSLVIRRAEDLRVAFNRAHHSGLYRTMLLPCVPIWKNAQKNCWKRFFLIFNISAPMNRI